MVYRIALLDDDVTELHKTEEMLILYGKTHPEHELKITCYSRMATFMDEVCGGESQAEWAFEILMMDIYLPDGNGIESAGVLRKRGFEGVVIFMSSSREHAMDAYSVNALQYLVKPISQEKLDRTITRAVKAICPYPVPKQKEETNMKPGGILHGKDQKAGRLLEHIRNTFFTGRK